MEFNMKDLINQAKKQDKLVEHNLLHRAKQVTNLNVNLIKSMLDRLTDIQVENIDFKDYPDFVDAYVSYAYSPELNRPLTDDELDYLNNEHPEFVSESIYNIIY